MSHLFEFAYLSKFFNLSTLIISFHHKFIFFPIPKTGTHSIRQNLREFLHLIDWEQCDLYEKKRFPIQQIAVKRHGHISFQNLEKSTIPGSLSQYYKFCFVRNPFDRFISYCYFINRQNSQMNFHPLDTMKRTIQDKSVQQQVLFKPQHTFVTDNKNSIAVNFIGKYENFQNDYNKICREIRIPAKKLPNINSSDRQPVLDLLDYELSDMILDYYKKDFEYFGYDTCTTRI